MDSGDPDLVARARRGDRAAFSRLAEAHGERLRRFLAVMTGDDGAAEDLRQETLMRAMQHVDQLEDPGKLGSWLLSIAANRCRSFLRDEVRRRAAGGEDLPELPDEGRRSALSSIARRESVAMLALAIDRLPIRLREAFVLFHQEQLPYSEITAITGASEGTLQVRVHRARSLLRQQLGKVVNTWWSRPS